jgi:glycosyltransferase involved in cell wall biosynthesis
MRVLFLTPRPVGEPHSGGTIKSAALLAHLERRHEVDVACFVPPGATWARGTGRTVTVPLDRPRTAGRLAASYLRRLPLSIERNRSREMTVAVRDLVRERGHDAVLADGWLMAQHVPPGGRWRRLLHEHNAEHRMWSRQAELERSPLRRVVVRLEASRVRHYEASILRRFDVVFAVSEPDRRALEALGAPRPVRLLANVAEPSLLERPALAPVREPSLLFLGTLSWQPNVEGMVRFLEDAMPALRRRMAGVRLVVAGSGASSRLVEVLRRAPGVELVGRIDDEDALYRSARAFVDPGLGGAGTRVKLLNAMARGLPAVATRDAADGLEVTPGEHLLVAGDAAGLVEALAALLGDDDLWRRLQERGRALVRERYVPEAAFAGLDEALEGGSGAG